MITIIDYGVGNIASIRNMLRRVEEDAEISSAPDIIAAAEKLILPGVGAFDAGVRQLHEAGIWEPLRHRVIKDGVPLLGICLGAQLLTEGSDEGELPGLGFIPGRTIAFDRTRLTDQRIPNMGWRYINPVRDSPLLQGLPDYSRFYFVHSFHLSCRNPENEIATAEHGYEFTAGVASGNVTGLQFHPEKSHRFGMRVLKNFALL